MRGDTSVAARMLSIMRREMRSTETYYGAVFWFMKGTSDETAEGSSPD